MFLLKKTILCLLSFIALCFLIPYISIAQNERNKGSLTNNNATTDSLGNPIVLVDSLSNDSILSDSIAADSIIRISPQAIESIISYTATDSIIFYTAKKIIKLYGNVEIQYENITLTAAYMEIDFNTKNLYATWVEDSAGNMVGKPIFKENDKWFESHTMKYNFDTKRGYLTNIFTEESEAYLHGKEVKKLEDDVILIRNGSFTTCPAPDPHFEVKFTKAKVIPDDKIITGPVWLVVEDVPLPLGLPFGFFPNKKGQQNGILLPRYGETDNRGFYLEDGGYYIGIKDFADLSLKGDIYSRGSWALKAASNYKLRYKFDGFLNVNYAYNRIGEPETPEFETSRDMFVVWKHNQDAKAHPKHRFNADVRAGTRNYSRFNPTSAQDYLSSTFSSSVSFSTVFGNNVNFSANVRHSQNKQTKTVDMNLPELTLSTNRLYPFRNKKRTGKPKIWENINLSYTMNARNSISSPDSLLFKDWQLKDFSNGVKHTIPLSLSQKVFKHFNLTTTATYNNRWYLQSLDKYWDDVTNTLITDTIDGFQINQDFQFSTQLQTKLYGMFGFKKGPIAAVRHIITPQVSITYRPDFGKSKWGVYQYYKDPNQELPTPYSVFQNGIYGSSPFGEAGIINMGISNNLEMKVRTPKDSLNPVKKVKLIDNFTISISHDIAKDSLKWSKLRLNGRTRLFNNLDLSYIALLDPYIIDSTGKNIDAFEWDVNNRLVRKQRNEWATSLSWSLGPNTFKKKSDLQNTQVQNTPQQTTQNTTTSVNVPAVDYSIPWSLNLAYTLQYIRNFGSHIEPDNKYEFIQTLTFNGEISLTPSWKIGVMSGYDFINNEFSYTSVNIYRDLHCWEIVFNWIPTGFRKSYNFTLRVKAPMLQDLKINKRTDWRDYY
jgi:hypothetical protein